MPAAVPFQSEVSCPHFMQCIYGAAPCCLGFTPTQWHGTDAFHPPLRICAWAGGMQLRVCIVGPPPLYGLV